jgi:solute:Na+ symporter, SSS family
MLLFIVIYIIVTIIVGLLASRLVHNTEDYLLAGRRLPMYMATATLFATWFGSETILGSASEFAKGGLIAVIRDPFGAAVCLLLVALFYARPLYRMRLLTFGDFYRNRYGKKVELLAAVCIILTYLGWIAAQMVAFGILLNALAGWPVLSGILVASLVVTLYTFTGGMWSVSVTDFLQMIFIVIGLAAASLEILGIVDLKAVVKATPDGFFRFTPDPGYTEQLNYLAAWMTIGLGALAGQDIFQRVMASRSERVAVWSSLIASLMYISVAMIPLLLALIGRYLLPEQVSEGADAQFLIPSLISKYTSPFVQILFFGALLSAILSTASSALLAPSAILGENIIRPHIKKVTDKQLLWISRFSVLIISGISLVMAIKRGNIYELVGEAASVGLVSIFVPLTAGVFWKKANTTGAIISITAGMAAWIMASLLDTKVNPILYGFFVSAVGMWAGTVTSQKPSLSK